MVVINREAWAARLASSRVPKDVLDALIMDYLVIQGYKSAAEAFASESSHPPPVDLSSISDRMSTRAALARGDVASAIETANSIDPAILDADAGLYFHLQQQKLIELIRAGDVDAALAFAEDELAPRGEENRPFLKELERTMTLLAFDEPKDAPMGDLLSPEQREKTAGELNAAILSSQCQDKEPKLPNLLKLLAWAQDQLRESCEFPVMDVRTGKLAEVEEGEDGAMATQNSSTSV